MHCTCLRKAVDPDHVCEWHAWKAKKHERAVARRTQRNRERRIRSGLITLSLVTSKPVPAPGTRSADHPQKKNRLRARWAHRDRFGVAKAMKAEREAGNA